MSRAALVVVLALGGLPSLSPAVDGRSPAIPFREDRPIDVDAGRLAAGIGLALAAGVAGLVVLRRRLLGATPVAGRRLRVVERLRVSPRTTILLLECDGEAVLLGEHPAGVVRLGGPGRAALREGQGAEPDDAGKV